MALRNRAAQPAHTTPQGSAPALTFEVIDGTGPALDPSPDDFELGIDTQEVDEHTEDGTVRFLPGEFYYRRAIRAAYASFNLVEMNGIARAVVTEHQLLKEWVRRRLGYIPPKWTVHPDEAAEKNWELLP